MINLTFVEHICDKGIRKHFIDVIEKYENTAEVLMPISNVLSPSPHVRTYIHTPLR